MLADAIARNWGSIVPALAAQSRMEPLIFELVAAHVDLMSLFVAGTPWTGAAFHVAGTTSAPEIVVDTCHALVKLPQRIALDTHIGGWHDCPRTSSFLAEVVLVVAVVAVEVVAVGAGPVPLTTRPVGRLAMEVVVVVYLNSMGVAALNSILYTRQLDILLVLHHLFGGMLLHTHLQSSPLQTLLAPTLQALFQCQWRSHRKNFEHFRHQQTTHRWPIREMLLPPLCL